VGTDGASIVYAVTSKAEADKRGVKLRENLLDCRAGWRDKTFLYQGQRAGRRHPAAHGRGVTTSIADFSPDGERVLLLREVEDVAMRPYTRKEVWELSLKTLYGKKLRDSRFASSVSYAPDGRRILIVSGPSEFGDLGRSVTAGRIANESDGQLYVLDPATGQAEALSRSFDPSILSATWSRADDVYVKATAKDARRSPPRRRRQELCRDRRQRTGGGRTVRRERSVAAAWSVGRGLPERSRRSTCAPARRACSQHRRRRRSPRCRGDVVPFPVTLKSGGTMDGRVYLRGFDKATVSRYPRSSTTTAEPSMSDDFGGRYPKEWWSAHGYVVCAAARGDGLRPGVPRHVNDWGKTTSKKSSKGRPRFSPRTRRTLAISRIGASYGAS
jgi:hypothetical protein